MPILSSLGALAARAYGMLHNIVVPNIYATWDPANKGSNLTLSNGNLTANANASSYVSTRSTIGVSTGRWYWETTINTGSSNNIIGVCNNSFVPANGNWAGMDTHGYSVDEESSSNANAWYNNVNQITFSTAFSAGDVIGIALDTATGYALFFRNNVFIWATSATQVISASPPYYASCGTFNISDKQTVNFGATAFTYTPPTGYNAGLYTGTVPLDGTFGLFALGGSSGSTTTNKYTYIGNIVAGATALTVLTADGAAVGNSAVGIFAIGGVSTGSTTTNKYAYSGDTTASATALLNVSRMGCAAGNTTEGIFALGSSFAGSSNKYTYSGDTVIAGGNWNNGANHGAAAGNSTRGIFAAGGGTTTNKYTYSTDTVVTSTALLTTENAGVAVGNAVEGLFVIGNNVTTTNKYKYSGDTVSTATALTTNAVGGTGAAGNAITGIISIGGPSTTSNNYTYANDTVVVGTVFTASLMNGSAASNGATGVNI